LEYVDDDWNGMDVSLDQIFGEDVVRHDFGYLTTAADYLNQMDLGQHFVQVCAHSFSGGHAFGTRPTESAVYAHVYVYSPVARSGRMMLGSNDGIKVWLNGNPVCTHDVYQNWTPDQFSHYVTLDEGWNQLLCKISQSGGAYEFSACITDFYMQPIPDLAYQLDDPDEYGRVGEFVRSWLLNGFHQDVSDNFWSYLDTNYLREDPGAIDPVDGQEMGGQVWTTYNSNGGYIDLGDHCGEADFGACYAYARVHTDAPQSCQLWLGYEDGIKVWLNGTQVLYDNRFGGYTPDMTKVNVNLVAGDNRLMVKVSEWMGAHGFSARFCHADGGFVEGLTYDPQPEPIVHIGSWLTNGPYCNGDQNTRLTEDYLGDEASVRPNEGDPAPVGNWIRSISSGYPVDLAKLYDLGGGWVYSQDIQDRDPPVLFYNLFACGPGRFTETDYLAGSYIFNTTYGLITVASAKSGSMLNFNDFTTPLGEGQTVGTAFREWFEAQAPFETWEREWYYGLILNGDPTLRPIRIGDIDRDGDIDLSDLAALLAAYNACSGDPLYEPAADLDNSGCVDLGDLAKLLSDYGLGT